MGANRNGLIGAGLAALALVVALDVAEAKVTLSPKKPIDSKADHKSTKPMITQGLRFDSPAGLRALRQLSIMTLRRGLRDRDPYERLFAASALGANGDLVGPVLLEDAFNSPDPLLKMASVDGLADIGDAKALAVLQRLFYGSSDPGQRRLVINGLSQLKDCAAEAVLIEALSENDPMVRVQAAQALGRLGRKDALPALHHLLATERDPLSQVVVAHAIILLGDSTPLDKMKYVAEHDSNLTAQALAALALGDARDASALPVLRRTLANQDWQVRMAAAAALTHYGNPDGLQILKDAAHHPDPTVRRQLGDLLEHVDFSIAREALLVAVGTDDPALQLAATRAIGLLGGDSEIGVLIETFRRSNDPMVRADVAWALGRIACANCIEPLVDMVANDDAVVRYTAADALARTTNRLLTYPNRN